MRLTPAPERRDLAPQTGLDCESSAVELELGRLKMKKAAPVPITALLPAFASELEVLASAANRPDLAARIRGLVVEARCTCGNHGCAHFYTAPKPERSYGPERSNLTLRPKAGMIVLDLLQDRIVGVEVLDRPDVKQVLDENFGRARRRGRA